MMKSHVVIALMALGGLTACSSWNGYGHSASAGNGAYAAAPALSSGTVMQVQTALQQQGFYKGSIDGLWGPETQGAVQSFQQAKGLTADGQLGPQTMAALNLSNANTASTAQPTGNDTTSSGQLTSNGTMSNQPTNNGSTTMGQPATTSNGASSSTQPMSNGSTSMNQPVSNGSTSMNQPMTSNGTQQSTASTSAPKPATSTQ